ncbi:MAG: flagellin [Candidatus Cloacimonetes bacterium]|nr:flagellin [Candidatus Cloacimonadota bacterium]
MAIVIAGNNLASYVNLQHNKIYSEMSNSIRKLSTGLRITSAVDDPAGLAVSEFMRSDITTLNQGERNLNDAISLTQTASGALDNINSQLVKMKTLAEQAATATYTDEQRIILQSEFTTLGAEIDRISNETTYNDINLLDGSLKSTSTYLTESGWSEPNSGLLIHFGTNANRNSDYYYISIPKIDTNAVFENTIPTIESQASAQSALSSIDSAIAKNSNYQAYLGGIQNRLESSLDSISQKKANLDNAYDKITNIDVVQEMTKYMTLSVLNQMNLFMMSQANLLPQRALKLLSFE